MNYEAAIFYAQQRMREIGKKPSQYHFEPVRIGASPADKVAGYFEIKAYNEIYIIVNPEKYFGLVIIGDNSTFDSDDANQSGAPEFTGLIRFIKSATEWNFEPTESRIVRTPIPVEFIRVVIY